MMKPIVFWVKPFSLTTKRQPPKVQMEKYMLPFAHRLCMQIQSLSEWSLPNFQNKIHLFFHLDPKGEVQ